MNNQRETLTISYQDREILTTDPRYALAQLFESQFEELNFENKLPDLDLSLGARELSDKINELVRNNDIAGLPFGHRSETYTPEFIAGLLIRISLGELLIKTPGSDEYTDPKILLNPYRHVSPEQEMAILHFASTMIPDLSEELQKVMQTRMFGEDEDGGLYGYLEEKALLNENTEKAKNYPVKSGRSESEIDSKKQLKREMKKRSFQIEELVNQLKKHITVENLRILDLGDEPDVPEGPVSMSIGNQMTFGFSEAGIKIIDELPELSLRVKNEDLVLNPPEELPADFETKNSFSQNLYTILISLAALDQISDKIPAAYKLNAQLWKRKTARELTGLLEELQNTNPNHKFSLADLYKKTIKGGINYRSIYSRSLLLLLASCTVPGVQNQTGDNNSQIIVTEDTQSESIDVDIPVSEPVSEASPTPERPDFNIGEGEEYSPEEKQLIESGAFAEQEMMLKSWVEYWGLAQNRPFHPQSESMKYKYFFDKNDPGNALVVLLPGNSYGKRTFYLPIGNGRFMTVPPAPPEGVFIDIPDGFGPLEISGGSEFNLANVGGNWVRVDSNNQIRQRINMETAQWQTSIETGNWAEKEDGSLNPEKMFPLVGAINKKHHQAVDLSYNDMRVAVVTNEDMTKKDAGSYNDSKNEQANQLNSNTGLKAKLDQIKSQIDQNKLLANYTVVIENGDIKWIIDLSGDIPLYFRLENTQLVQLPKEEEPHLLPELRVNGPYIERADTGEKIQFTGISMDVITRKSGESILSYVKEAVEKNEAIGIDPNIVLIMLRASDADSPEGLEDILNTAKYLEAQGRYFVINPINNIGEDFSFPNEAIEIALGKIATKLANRNNVIFNLFNEVGVLPNGLTPEWQDWTPWIIRLTNAIKQPYLDSNKNTPFVLVGGIGWSRDFRNSDIPLDNNTWAANVHNYRSRDCDTCPWYEIDDQWNNLVGKVPVWITENGALMPIEAETEDVDFVTKTLAYASKNPMLISYLMWNAGNPGGDSTRDNDINISPKGLALINSEVYISRTVFTE